MKMLCPACEPPALGMLGKHTSPPNGDPICRCASKTCACSVAGAPAHS